MQAATWLSLAFVHTTRSALGIFVQMAHWMSVVDVHVRFTYCQGEQPHSDGGDDELEHSQLSSDYGNLQFFHRKESTLNQQR
jgi:hypothetical protein